MVGLGPIPSIYTCDETLPIKQISPRIALAQQESTGGRTTEVLPALKNVLLEGFQPSGPVQEGIARLIYARQLTNHPVAIWDRSIGGLWVTK